MRSIVNSLVSLALLVLATLHSSNVALAEEDWMPVGTSNQVTLQYKVVAKTGLPGNSYYELHLRVANRGPKEATIALNVTWERYDELKSDWVLDSWTARKTSAADLRIAISGNSTRDVLAKSTGAKRPRKVAALINDTDFHVGELGLPPLATPKTLATCEITSGQEMVISFDGKFALIWSHATTATSSDSTTSLWNVNTVSGRLDSQATLVGDFGECVCAAFSPDGKRFATGYHRGQVRIWATSSSGSVQTPLAIMETSDRVTSLCFTSDSQHVAAVHGAEVKLWAANVQGTHRQTLATFSNDGGGKVACSPCGKFLVSTTDTGYVDQRIASEARLWDATSRGDVKVPLATCTGQLDRISAIAFSTSGSLFAVTSGDGVTRVWSTAGRGTNAEPWAVLRHRATRIAFAPGEGRVVTADEKAHVRVWDIAPGGDIQRSELLNGFGDIDASMRCEMLISTGGTLFVVMLRQVKEDEKRSVGTLWAVTGNEPGDGWNTVDGMARVNIEYRVTERVGATGNVFHELHYRVANRNPDAVVVTISVTWERYDELKSDWVVDSWTARKTSAADLRIAVSGNSTRDNTMKYTTGSRKPQNITATIEWSYQ